MSQRPARYLRGLALFAAIGLLSAAPPFAGLDRGVMDFVHTVFYPRSETSEDITLIVIDERTIDNFDARNDHEIKYLSPIDRGMLADIIAHVAAGDPAAIGLDVVLDRRTEARKDAALLEVMRNAPMVLAVAGADMLGSDERLTTLSYFTKDARVGHALFWKPDAGGAVRAIPGKMTTVVADTPALAVALAQQRASVLGDAPIALAFSLPVDPLSPRFPIYRGEEVSLIPSEWFKDQIVIIGVDFVGIDRHRTPLVDFDPATPSVVAGFELHAQFTQQLIEGRGMRSTPLWGKALAAFLAGALGWAAVHLPVRRRHRVLAVVGVAAGLMASLPLALVLLELRWPALATLASAPLGAVGAAIDRWRTAKEARRRLIDGFGKFLAPSLVKKIAAEPDVLNIGGERRDVTLIFTDVEGFTAAVENSDPERFAQTLNAYLDGMSSIIVRHGGTLDKFVGDAVVSFFGAPVIQHDHAAAAVRAALELDSFATRFSTQSAQDGLRFGITRIGVHTGEAIVGNFGGERFFDYTAIGDTVNTAARLEGANKALGTRLCVSEAVVAAARRSDPELLFRPIDEIDIRGRKQPVSVYQPAKRTSSVAERFSAYQDAFDIRFTDPARAISLFASLTGRDPDDHVAQYWLARLERADPISTQETVP